MSWKAREYGSNKTSWCTFVFERHSLFIACSCEQLHEASCVPENKTMKQLEKKVPEAEPEETRNRSHLLRYYYDATTRNTFASRNTATRIVGNKRRSSASLFSSPNEFITKMTTIFLLSLIISYSRDTLALQMESLSPEQRKYAQVCVSVCDYTCNDNNDTETTKVHITLSCVCYSCRPTSHIPVDIQSDDSLSFLLFCLSCLCITILCVIMMMMLSWCPCSRM